MSFGGQSYGRPRGVSNDRKVSYAAERPATVPRLPVAVPTPAWSELPALIGSGCRRSLLPSPTELILLNAAAAFRILSLDCTGGGGSSSNYDVAPGNLSGFAILGDSDDASELVLPGQYNFTRESVGVFARSNGAVISEPSAVDPMTNAQMFAAGIEGNARIWYGQSSGGSGERALYTPTTPGPELYENNTTANGGSLEPGTMVKLPGSDDVIFVNTFPASDTIQRQAPDGSIAWAEGLGDTNTSGSISTNTSQVLTIHDGRVYYFARNPDGRTMGNGDYICSRLLADGSDWQEHANVNNDTTVANVNLRCLKRDAGGDWWALVQNAIGVDTDVVRYDADFALVHSWLDVDPTNDVFDVYHTTGADRFHDLHFLPAVGSGRILILSGNGTSRLRITAMDF